MNAIADLARENAMSVEAKKHALRQQQDGCWIMTLRVHPSDMPEQIMKAPMGTRYMLALVEIGDDEQPLPPHPAVAAPRPAKAPQPSPPPVGENKHKRPFAEWAPAQQAGMLCSDKSFQKFLCEKYERYWVGVSDDGRYLSDRPPPERWKAIAAVVVRMILDVDSRADITPENADWSGLVLAYRLWQREPEFV